MKKTNLIHASGKRKTAIARATLRKGKGNLVINGKPISEYTPELNKLRIQEPLVLVGKVANELNISVKVEGGGYSSQADAIRLAIGRALVEHDNNLKALLVEYDRQLLVADVRRKESAKPNRNGSARAKRQKSYR